MRCPPQAPRIRCGCRLVLLPRWVQGYSRLKLRESAADAAQYRCAHREGQGPPQAPRIRCGCREDIPRIRSRDSSASSSENPLRMPPSVCPHCNGGVDRLKLRESAADAAENLIIPDDPLCRLKLRESAADAASFEGQTQGRQYPPQAPRIRCGCRCPHAPGLTSGISASSSENPLRMPPLRRAHHRRASLRLKLRESAADAAWGDYSAAKWVGPPQAPRIRCGCRVYTTQNATPLSPASSSENPLRMPPVVATRGNGPSCRLKLRESAADAALAFRSHWP